MSSMTEKGGQGKHTPRLVFDEERLRLLHIEQIIRDAIQRYDAYRHEGMDYNAAVDAVVEHWLKVEARNV